MAQETFTVDDTRQALNGKSLMTQRIIYCESRYDPYARNSRSGAIGAAQLLPGAHNGLAIFYSFGYTDPYNPWEAVDFVEEVIQRGMVQSQYGSTMYGCPGSP